MEKEAMAPAENPFKPREVEADQLERLLTLRQQILRERDCAPSPAVVRALTVADNYLFIALGYFGYSERLFPEQS